MAANVLLAKCRDNKTFGIRIEKRGDDWVSTWAFPIDESKAKREGFDKTKITGTLRPVDEYPGCSYCGSSDLLQCSCGKMICYKEGRNGNINTETKNENKTEVKCPWCGVTINEIKIVESFTVKSGGL